VYNIAAQLGVDPKRLCEYNNLANCSEISGWCGALKIPVNGPVTPTPAPGPGPSGQKYLCDTANLQCVPNAQGTQTKDQCAAVCKHFSSQ
jgi:hypothetical protein